MEIVGDIVFNLMLGIGAICYGLWNFKNPTKAIPVWLFRNPRNPTLMAFVRGEGLLFVFFGAFVVIAPFTDLILPGSVAWIVALICAIVSTWFLRLCAPEHS